MRICNQNIKKNIFSIADNISISIYKLSMKYFNLLTELIEFNRNKHYICRKTLSKLILTSVGLHLKTSQYYYLSNRRILLINLEQKFFIYSLNFVILV